MTFFFTNNLVPLLTLLALTFNIQSKDPLSHQIGLTGCSAVYVGPNEALTAAHCVSESTGHMWVKTEAGKSYTASILLKDRHLDLCLIRVNGPAHVYTHLGPPVKLGNKIYQMSNANGMGFTYGEGIVMNVLLDDDRHVLTVVHNAPILPGSSGSGLFNSKGEIVGINTQSLDAFSYAVDVTVIESFLNRNFRR